MRKVFLCFLCCVLCGCSSAPVQLSPITQDPRAVRFMGAHRLRQVNSLNLLQQETHVAVSSGLFSFSAAYDKNAAYVSTDVHFAWEDNEHQYRFYTLPLKMVRIALLQDDGTPPFVTFKWLPSQWWYGEERFQPDEEETEGIEYAVIHCSAKDWPASVQMPVVP